MNTLAKRILTVSLVLGIVPMGICATPAKNPANPNKGHKEAIDQIDRQTQQFESDIKKENQAFRKGVGKQKGDRLAKELAFTNHRIEVIQKRLTFYQNRKSQLEKLK